jgi:restriction system protein
VERRNALSFLDAVEVVLAGANVPLHPNEIAEIALRDGLIDSAGATPEQTIKAKLSTDILTQKHASRFMRVEQNRFGLRCWKGRYRGSVSEGPT